MRCPLCQHEVEMRDFCGPPYRFGLAGVSSVVVADHPNWKEAEGFCNSCSNLYRSRLKERKRIADDILDAINDLPDMEKRVFVFYHYRGLGIQEIAAHEQLEEQIIREMLSRAARALYQRLHSHIPMAKRIGLRVTR